MSSPTSVQQTLSELDALKEEVQRWHIKASSDLATLHSRLTNQIRGACEAALATSVVGSAGGVPPPAANHGGFSVSGGGHLPSTPQRQVVPKGHVMDGISPSVAASPPMGNPASAYGNGSASGATSNSLDYNMLIDELQGKKGASGGGGSAMPATAISNNGISSLTGTPSKPATRPTPDTVTAEAIEAAKKDAVKSASACQVLVEFKRKRVLQFESPIYVAPGEYVVVGGDRGEDMGLVTHTWSATGASAPGAAANVAKWEGVGLGKVLRVASPVEVARLHGVQTELETRAVEVAQEKVMEHQLPMKIVDAEYQFDRKKLTFFFQANQRLDFRLLVRDLYKTFHARIWMEMD